MKRLLLLSPFLLMTGCATLSEDQCRAGNWYDIGRSDGANGRQENFLTQHTKACGDYSITPNAHDWERGRQDGIPLYCVPARAYEDGTRGKHLSPVCPTEDLRQLERANARGLAYRRVDEEIKQIEREIAQTRAKISHLPPDDPARAILAADRSFLRLDLLRLRSERIRLSTPL